MGHYQISTQIITPLTFFVLKDLKSFLFFIILIVYV